MPILIVDKTLTFNFNSSIAAEPYDKWQHYTVIRNATPGGKKAVDIVAVDDDMAWLIEAKDFRVITNPPKPSNIAGLAHTVAAKANDTLAGLTDASSKALVTREKQHATNAITCASQRIVLHLEPHTGIHTALFPKGFSALVLQQLRQLVKHPLVLNIANTPQSGVPWTVS